MKRIGIITMHKPLSFGSALQTYALQRKITELGYEVRIIDYKYPNEAHKQRGNQLRHYVELLMSFIVNMFYGFQNYRKKSKFREFQQKYYKLTRSYPNEQALKDNPPVFDIYLTGSDQVWNPNFILEDRAFLLSFVNAGGKRVSYASSFAVSTIPESYKPSYKECLSKYETITVREMSGIEIVKKLTGKKATLVCDPTLLLSANEWDEIAGDATIDISEPYILVFILGYSFNPYPQVKHIISKVQQQLDLKVIFLDGRRDDIFHKNSKIIKNGGPADFINLVRNASYVITDSFHGTVFSTIYSRPLIALVKPGNTDSRILSFLQATGREKNAVPYTSRSFEIPSEAVESQSKQLIDDSLAELKKMLS